MTSIRPGALRSTLQQLQAAPVVDQAGVNRALDAALADGTLTAGERAALGALVSLPADRFDAAATRQRLQSLLDIPDDGVLALAHKLTRDDGVLDIRDATAIAALIEGKGAQAGSGVASLRALMIGSKLTRGAERTLESTARALGGNATPEPRISEKAFKQASASNFTALYWEDFSATPTSARLCQRYGEAKVKAAFERLAKADGNEALAATDAATIARGPLPSSELERALVNYARQQLTSDYLQNRWGAFVPWSLRDTQTKLGEVLRKAGLSCNVHLTGYTGKDRNWKINELTLRQLDANDWKRLQESPGLQRALCRALGRGVRWDSLDIRHDRDAQVARLATEAPARLAAPEPMHTPADFITHHNQSLDAWQRAHEKKLIGDGNVLLHVDAHSDLYWPSVGGSSIADYINAALRQGLVKEVYWVVPAGMQPLESSPPDGPVSLEARPPYDLSLWELDGALLREAPTGPDATRARPFTLHVRTMDQVPVAELRERRDVLLDVDLDYFSNSGFDSSPGTVHNNSTAELHRGLEAFGRFSHALQPTFTTLCMSPEFTSVDDRDIVRDYARQLFPQDLIANRADAYAHSNNPSADEGVLSILMGTVARPDLRTFNPELADALRTRGLDEVAAAYQRFCDGKLQRAGFLRILNRALNIANGGRGSGIF